VDGSRRGVEILEKHGEESISVHEVFDEVQAQRIAYEPFSGSGSQIIAGEREGRRVYAMEISPAYVAVTLERWAEATGGKPELSERKP
jgi:hypothetical protein